MARSGSTTLTSDETLSRPQHWRTRHVLGAAVAQAHPPLEDGASAKLAILPTSGSVDVTPDHASSCTAERKASRHAATRGTRRRPLGTRA